KSRWRGNCRTRPRSAGPRSWLPTRPSPPRTCAGRSSTRRTWCACSRCARSGEPSSAPAPGGDAMQVALSINGEKHEADVEPRLLLVHLIRDVLRLTGTHIGCDTTHCGACTVLMDGRPVKSCTVFAVQARGKEIMTVEGLEQNGALHPLQEG